MESFWTQNYVLSCRGAVITFAAYNVDLAALASRRGLLVSKMLCGERAYQILVTIWKDQTTERGLFDERILFFTA